MRKKVLIVLLFFSGTFLSAWGRSPETGVRESEPAKHQDALFTGGPVLEMNLSNFLHSGTSGGSSKMKAGFTAGGFLNFGINKLFSIQGEVLFHYKNSDFEWSSQKGSFRYWGMEIPVYAMCHHSFSKGDRLFVGIGPYTEFGLDATFRHDGRKQDLYEKNADSGLAPLRDSNSGFGIKAGYEFISGFQLHVSYKMSVSNLLDERSGDAKMRPQAISIGVSYRFGK